MGGEENLEKYAEEGAKAMDLAHAHVCDCESTKCCVPRAHTLCARTWQTVPDRFPCGTDAMHPCKDERRPTQSGRARSNM